MGTAPAGRQDLRAPVFVLSLLGRVRMRLGAGVRQALVRIPARPLLGQVA